MVIGKGEAWGEPCVPPPDLVTAADDAELGSLAAEAFADGRRLVAEVRSGDLAATLGVRAGDGSGGTRAVEDRMAFTIDLGFASLDDGEPRPFVAHLVAHRTLWAGSFVVVMNAAWLGRWYLGPRAHPNDGLLDITEGSLSLRQRLLARSRVRTGSHLPHPELRATRKATWEGRFDRPTEVVLDGRSAGPARLVRAWIEPDCLTLFA